MRFAVLTDLHIGRRGEAVHGVDTLSVLRAAVSEIARFDVDFLLLTGDLAERGEEESYRLLAEALEPLPCRIHFVLGNHDRRRSFRRVFADAPTDDHGFLQYRVDMAAATLLVLDTLHEPSSTGSGWLCRDRLDWLDRTLPMVRQDVPLILAMHHPPFEIPSTPFSECTVESGADHLAEIFSRRRSPDLLMFGHIHRTLAGTWRSIPFRGQRSLTLQLGLQVDRFVGTPLAPEYGLVFLRDGLVCAHTCEVGETNRRRQFDPPAASKSPPAPGLERAVGGHG